MRKPRRVKAGTFGTPKGTRKYRHTAGFKYKRMGKMK